MRVQDEVHHARNRVRAVHRGRTAGEHVDALDQCCGDLVDVREVATVTGAWAETAPVDQHQGALGTQAAQVDLGGTVGAV